MRELEFPFDSEWILKKKKSIRRQLLETDSSFLEKKIAVLGGSTTNQIVDCLNIFLLNIGIKAEFYQSEYNKYWEDVMFDNPELVEFKPDLIWIHTTSRNITNFPALQDSAKDVEELLDAQFSHYAMMWEKIRQTYACPIIQNNFEQPYYRLLGNADVSNIHGRLNYVNRLNDKLYEYANTHDNFFIHDVNYMASCYGIQKWSDPFYWYMYKYAMCVPAIPEFAHNLSLIVKSIFGRNKKAFVLDMDNTLWGGIVGEDGPDNIEIGHETPKAEMFTEFQQYLKAHKQLGVLLTIDSKNDEENALAGLARPDSTLKKDDFVCMKANWNPKDLNINEIATELNLGADSFVFVDDNPAEREIVKQGIKGVAVPEVGEPETYIHILDRSGYFEMTYFSDDDLKRNEMYAKNSQREKEKLSFANYEDYLVSLEMHAEIEPFNETYMARIAQLTNKSNQFNLTTLRCTQSDVEGFAASEDHITLYGRLEDKFGDNGVVTVVSGHAKDKELHIDLWLMSCRVLKRDMEKAMMDELMDACKKKGYEKVVGYYYPTPKNNMVKEFYGTMGFEQVAMDEDGNSTWVKSVADYQKMNTAIAVNEGR